AGLPRVYVGEWLPEPLLTDDRPKLDPAAYAEQADSLSLAFLVVLEQLTPVERGRLPAPRRVRVRLRRDRRDRRQERGQLLAAGHRRSSPNRGAEAACRGVA